MSKKKLPQPDEELPGRPICHCRSKPIGPHWHEPEKYGCPLQPVPAPREPGPLQSLQDHFHGTDEECTHEDPVCCDDAIDEDEIALIDAAMCSHGNPGYCEACTEAHAMFLDPSDPFEAVLMDIVNINRRKRRDYALDGSPFSNFDTSAAGMGLEGFGAVESAVFNVNQKLARLRSLRANGRLDDPANESVTDTYLDLAVYGVIALAIHVYPDGKVPWISQ